MSEEGMEDSKSDRVLRPKNAAAKLGVVRQTLYSWAKEGLLPSPIKLGRRAVGWRESVLDDFIKRRELRSAA
jgi:prophage regulatory protein